MTTHADRILDVYRAYHRDPVFHDLRSTHGPKKVVPGRGSLTPRVILVGEAPGRMEQETRKPFSGAAGGVLDRLLADIGLTRRDIWLTNVVKYRPTIGTHTVRNRTPNTREQIASWPYLYREVDTFPPDIPLITMGKVALAAYHWHPHASMTANHGTAWTGRLGRECFAWFHPAYAVYEPERYHDMRTDALAFRHLYL